MKALKISIFIILLLAVCAAPRMIRAQPSEVLLMHRTNFSDAKFFIEFNNSYINTTQNYLILNSSEGVRIYEDFNDWSIMGPDVSKINASTIYYDGNMRYLTNNWAELVKNLGQSFSIQFKLNVDTVASATQTLRGSIVRYGTHSEDYRYHLNNNYEAINVALWSLSSTSKYQLTIQACENGGNVGSNNTLDLNVDQNYWVKFNRTGYLFGLYVYSDEDLTTLETSIDFDASAIWSQSYNNFDKLGVLSNYGYASSLSSQVYLSDLWLGNMTGGYITNGTAYTNNFIEGNLTAFSLFCNRTIPSDTAIKIFYSQDNETFNLLKTITPNGAFTYVDLEHMNLTKLYLKIQLLTNNSLVSPTINELYVLEKYQAEESGMIFGNVTWLEFGIWVLMVALGYSKDIYEVKITGAIYGIVFGLVILSQTPLFGFLTLIISIVLLAKEASTH